MADISIDRLSLSLAGLSAQRGERIARKIADGLVSAGQPPGLQRIDAPSLDLTLHGSPNETDDELASRIVNELIRKLNRIA
jgi:hypothetical protein